MISDESKVVKDDQAEPLPAEIVPIFEAARVRRDPLQDLAEEVRIWLGAVRYEASEPQQTGNRTVDITATLDLGTVKQRVFVRCIGGEIRPTDVDSVDKLLDRKIPQGWLISDTRVSESARERGGGQEGLQVFSLSDFLRQKVWGPYFDALTSMVARDRIEQLYVDFACYKEMDDTGGELSREEHPSLDSYIDSWLKERGKMHVSLLGGFGAGKTWFCRHYAFRQLQRYLKDPANERLPVLITLRMFTKSMTVEQLINDALLEQYKLQFLGSAFQVFQEMNRRGKLLLILDGFDEMARQVDYQTVVDNFWELARLVDQNSKVILTSRTEYFRWAKESEKILGGLEFGRKILVLEPPKFEVIYLQLLKTNQIREVIRRRVGESGAQTTDRILANRNLAEMAQKPVLIELLLAALDEVSGDVLENPGHVYLYATNKLLLRNMDTRRTFTSTADKVYFLCELAWEMIKTSNLRIHYGGIPERIKSYFGARIKDQHELDTWDFDLRNQTLLHRDAAGYYEFAHKSLAEYFVSLKFAAELGCLDPVFSNTYVEADGHSSELAFAKRTAAELVDTFGAMSFRDPVMRPIREFLAEVGNKNHGMLWDTLSQTKGLAPENIGFTAGNIATLLCLQKQVFTGRSLAGIALLGAEIGFELDSVDLTGAIARKTSFRNANLRNAKMKDIELDPGSLVGADLRDVEGVDDRFYRFVSYPFIEPFWPSARRRAESSLIYDFDAALGNDRPNVLLLHGARSLDPRTTGPLDALLGIARTAFGRLHRGVFYFSLFRRSSFFIAKFRTWSTARWPSLDFYRSLATFMTISGCPELYQFLEAEALLGQGAVVAAENDPEILSIIKSAFQKNRWVIFIDAAGFSSADRNIFPLLKTLASEGLATRIFVAVKDVPAELLGKHLQAINLSWLTLKSGA